MDKHSATIKDVASSCGLSVATVSRVLNNAPNVKPESRELVQNAVRSLNYIPNRLAASLKNNITHTIGLISIDLSNPAQMAIAREIEAYISNYGYVLFIMNSQDDAQKERTAVQSLNEYMVDGIILTATGKNDDLLVTVQRSGRPVVVLDRRPATNNLNYVGADKCAGCYDASMLLIKMGYRRISFINGPRDISTSFDRFNGFVRALYDTQLPVHNDFIFHGPFTSEFGQQCFRQLWAQKVRPDAIISGSEMISVGVLEATKELGICIPEDVGFLSFGNVANPSLIDPKLTYLESYPGTVGLRAAELMISMLESPVSLPSQITIPTALVMGSSLRQQ